CTSRPENKPSLILHSKNQVMLSVELSPRVVLPISSEKTGYPPSALGLDARLEAELGIDSIKRVEIVTAFRRDVAPHITEPPSWFVQKMISPATCHYPVSEAIYLKQPNPKQPPKTKP